MEQDLSASKDTQKDTLKEDNKTDNVKHTPQTLEKVQADLAASDDKYLRLYSEFENFRRRAAKEKLILIETAGEAMLKKLLPVADDFERALASFQTSDQAPQVMQEGVRLIYEKLMHLLPQADVKPMLIDKGVVFDTELHEAVTQVPVEDKAMKGKVLDVVEKGYLLKDKVLRFAKVVTGA